MPKGLSHSISQSAVYKLRSRSKLAKILGISLPELRKICVGDILYREFDIPKKDGGVRHVENPIRPLKLAQARLARLLARIAPPDYLYCPVKGRCYVSNAYQHIGNRVIRSIDIKKFYPNVTSKRVFWFFHKIMRCERDIAGLLTAISTYMGHLPTGSPLSPILGYFSHYDLWQRMSAFCKSRGYILTVYVDDCTISGSAVPERDMWQIRKMIHSSGLRYHKEKLYIDCAAEVTGVIVKGGKVLVPHRQYRKLKLASDALSTVRLEDVEREALSNQDRGLRSQIRQITRLAS